VDILTHTLTGVAVAFTAGNLRGVKTKSLVVVIAVAAIGGALPDIDAISLWSGFDATFGTWFNLEHTGRQIYSARLWYSHHAFFHSLLASIMFTAFLAIGLFGKSVFIKSNGALKKNLNVKLTVLVSFFLAYNFHLLEDMLTPSSSWGGVAYLWPASNYTGGWGHIWWWNNYDLFALVLIVILANAGIHLLLRNRRAVMLLSLVFFMVGLVTASRQIGSRQLNYNYSGSKDYMKMEEQSLNEQKDILGERAYNMMRRLDNALPFYF